MKLENVGFPKEKVGWKEDGEETKEANRWSEE